MAVLVDAISALARRNRLDAISPAEARHALHWMRNRGEPSREARRPAGSHDAIGGCRFGSPRARRATPGWPLTWSSRGSARRSRRQRTQTRATRRPLGRAARRNDETGEHLPVTRLRVRAETKVSSLSWSRVDGRLTGAAQKWWQPIVEQTIDRRSLCPGFFRLELVEASSSETHSPTPQRCLLGSKAMGR